MNPSKRLKIQPSDAPQPANRISNPFPEECTTTPQMPSGDLPVPLEKESVIQVAKTVDSVFESLIVVRGAEAEDFGGRRAKQRSWYYTWSRYLGVKQRLQGQYVVFTDVISRHLLSQSFDNGSLESFSPDLEAALPDHLYDSFLRSLRILKRTLEALDEELKSLNAQLTGTASMSGEAHVKMQKAIWNTQASRYEELFDRVERNTIMLLDLLTPSINAPSMMEFRPISKTNIRKTPLLDVCTNANGLYKLFSEAWNCTCKSKHRFKLLLKHRQSEKAGFCIYLLFEETQSQSTRTWGHGQAVFEIIEKMPSNLNRKVFFADTPKVGSPSGAPIKEFCGFIHKASNSPESSSYISFLDDENQCYWVKLVGLTDRKELGGEYTLATALDNALTQEHGHLCLVDRWAIALVLASSVLQLYSTPWVKRNWGKNDICFLRNGPGVGSLQSSYTWEEPWLSFDWRTEMKGGSLIPQNDTLGLQDPEERLAIVLLELGFCKPIESSPYYLSCMTMLSSTDNKSARRMIEELAAIEWQRHIMKETCQYFADAIKWCLENPAKNTSKSTSSWMQQFYEHVILPLEKCTKFSTADDKSDESQSVKNSNVQVETGGVYIHHGTFEGSQGIGGYK